MLLQYLKSVWQQLRQQPVISLVTVAGTALAIFLFMLVVMIEQVVGHPFCLYAPHDDIEYARSKHYDASASLYLTMGTVLMLYSQSLKCRYSCMACIADEHSKCPRRKFL